MKTLAQLAQEAMDIQNAVNPVGLARSYAEALNALSAQGYGTDTIRRHPINRMWASKLHDLASMGISDLEAYAEAYDACKALAQPKCPYCQDECTQDAKAVNGIRSTGKGCEFCNPK